MTVSKSSGGVRTAIAGIAGMATVALLSISGLAAADTPAPAVALDAPPTEQITLDVTTVNGSGCPAGTAAVRMLQDNTAFRINYSAFVARDGVAATPIEFRKNCQANVVIHVPGGFTFSVSSANYRGRASLRPGATALHRTNYYFQGSPENNVINHNFTGPLSGGWNSTHATASADLVYGACGEDRSLNINTELRVNSPTGTSWMSLRTSDGDVETIFHVNWMKC